jgi:alpha/beta superfamily hydrolase
MVIEPVKPQTADGLTLEGELCVPGNAWAASVLAHPHPVHGGSMRSIVIGALFEGLPRAGVAALRFNFRGVGASEGTFADGRGERLDVVASLDALHEISEGLPLVLAGWSFGADTSLAVDDERHAGWFAVAPPLRRAHEMRGGDPRPKLLVVPQHDQFRAPDSAREATASWTNTRIEVVAGADHFLVGRTERVVELAVEFLGALSRPEHG